VKTGKIVSRLVIVLVLIALAVWIGLRAKQNLDAKKAAANTPPPEKIVPIETAVPTRMEIVERFRASANIVPDAEVTLFSKVPGKIAQNLVKVSSDVQPGQVVSIVNRDEVGYEFKPFEVKSDAKGVVARLMVNPGAMVGPTVPILTLVDIDTVKAMAAVDEKKIRFVRLGQSVLVTLEAYPGERFAANVTNISPVANPVGRTIEVELSIPNPGHRIKPGMYAEAEWIESRRSAMVVPLASLVDRAGAKFVFRAEGAVAKQIPVTTGAVVGGFVEILSGLDGTEMIVTTGASDLLDQGKIRVAEAKAAKK
jgi:multidrug efflux pump subunit AcrA (membrane-fusion protein)